MSRRSSSKRQTARTSTSASPMFWPVRRRTRKPIASSKFTPILTGRQQAFDEARELKGSIERINRINRDGAEPVGNDNGERIFHRPQAIESMSSRLERQLVAAGVQTPEEMLEEMQNGRERSYRGLSETVKGSLDHIFDPQAATLSLADADPAEQRLAAARSVIATARPDHRPVPRVQGGQ